MGLSDDWAEDFQRRLNERMFGYTPDPRTYEYDEAFGNFGHRGKYRTAFGTPSYGPPHLRHIYRCTCGRPESEHDDDGNAYGIPGMGCEPMAHDEFREQIKEWASWL